MLPDEFFTQAELAVILDTPQKARQCKILKEMGVPFVPSVSGHPRVYRDKLLPESKPAQNDAFDFSALASRKAKETKK